MVKPLVLIVHMLYNAIYQINHFPADECLQNKLHYPWSSDLSNGSSYPPFEQHRARVVSHLHLQTDFDVQL